MFTMLTRRFRGWLRLSAWFRDFGLRPGGIVGGINGASPGPNRGGRAGRLGAGDMSAASMAGIGLLGRRTRNLTGR